MTNPSDTLAPVQVGRAFLDAIVAGDLDALDALLAPTATWWVQGWGMLDRGALLRGLSGTIGRSSERAVTIFRTTAEGDRVAIEAEGHFSFAEGPYCNNYVYIFTIDAQGRIAKGKEYLDTAVAARFYAAKD
jgi:ketosteroid isomerase-like protein